MDVSHTVTPKSNQLNFDDLIAGPITILITGVKVGDSADQPVDVRYEGDNGKPYKPCKSMRRVLIHAWGTNGRDWVGKSMTLYGDPEVRFGGQAVGGIRISHLSHIDRDMNMMLTVTRAKRAPYNIKKLVIKNTQPAALKEYPQADFDAAKDRMKESIESGKATVNGIIAYLEKTAPVTEDQRMTLAGFVKISHAAESTSATGVKNG